MAELGERNKVAVSWMGKVKTTSQMLALGGLLWRYNVYMETLASTFLVLSLCKITASAKMPFTCLKWHSGIVKYG